MDHTKNLGHDKQRIKDWYLSQEPSLIMKVIFDDPTAGDANVDPEGIAYLKYLLEESIALEQHVQFRGSVAENILPLDPPDS